MPPAAALRIMRGPIGDAAVAGGWHVMLHSFICEHHRLPEPREVDTIKRKASSVTMFVQDSTGGPPILAKAAGVLQSRRDQLAADYEAGVWRGR